MALYRRIVAHMLLLVSLPAALSSAGTQTEAVVQAAESVALVRAERARTTIWTCGTVVHRHENRAYVLTSRELLKGTDASPKEVVFFPGSGRATVLPAEITGHIGRSFVVLSAEGPGLPEALAPAAEVGIEPGENLDAIGFHFTSLTSHFDRRGVQPLIAPVAVPFAIEDSSSPELLTLHGFVETGFLGGPVLTRDGHMIGIIQTHETRQPQVTALSAAEIAAALTPKSQGMSYHQVASTDRGDTLRLRTYVRDPLRQIVSIKVHVLYGTASLRPEAQRSSRYPCHPSPDTVETLTTKPSQGGPDLHVSGELPLPPASPNTSHVSIQLAFLLENQSMQCEFPLIYRTRSAQPGTEAR